MGVTKTALFTPQQNKLAEICKALGHPARIAILLELIKVNQCICGDLVDVLPLSQPTVSQHLKALRSSGIIKGEVEGTKVCYCIDEENWSGVKSLLVEFLEAFKVSGCC